MSFKGKELLIMMVGHKKPKVKEELKHGLGYVLVPRKLGKVGESWGQVYIASSEK